MGVRLSDFAIRAEKDAMLRRVNAIRKEYARLDDALWTMTQNQESVAKAIAEYSAEMRKPIMKFFAGDVLEETVQQAHEAFLKSLKKFIEMGQVKIQRDIRERLLESVKTDIVRNLDTMMAESKLNLTNRAFELRKMADSGAFKAADAGIDYIQIKIESITSRTIGGSDSGAEFTKGELKKAWEKLQDRYGSRDTVKYRDGKNYPLNTYLDGRARTTATDVHILTTQVESADSGIYTGKVSSHGASDSCSKYEGRMVCMSDESRAQISRTIPAAAKWPTVQELRADKDSHIFKFNCTHTVISWPIHLFDKQDQKAIIEAEAA